MGQRQNYETRSQRHGRWANGDTESRKTVKATAVIQTQRLAVIEPRGLGLLFFGDPERLLALLMAFNGPSLCYLRLTQGVNLFFFIRQSILSLTESIKKISIFIVPNKYQQIHHAVYFIVNLHTCTVIALMSEITQQYNRESPVKTGYFSHPKKNVILLF